MEKYKVAHMNNVSTGKGIAYIVPPYLGDTAISENTRRRKEILTTLEFTIHTIEHQEGRFIDVCIRLWKLRKIIRSIIIRIDGTCVLDKYTLLKLILPRHVFIWEIHGFPEECLEFSETFSTRWQVWKNSIKRKVLSLLVNACIFISPELYGYAEHKIYICCAVVIPNFVKSHEAIRQQTHHFLLPFLLEKKAFVVLWGGDASLPWQATDLIQKVAREVQKHDKNILFFLVGEQHYYPPYASKNIVYLRSMPYAQFTALINQSDVCLALYHKPKHIPFYFYPMKLIDYLSAGKPVIATKLGSINTLIEHNVSGFVTDNNSKNITNIILQLKQNKGLAKKIARNALIGAKKRLSWHRARSSYQALFRSLR